MYVHLDQVKASGLAVLVEGDRLTYTHSNDRQGRIQAAEILVTVDERLLVAADGRQLSKAAMVVTESEPCDAAQESSPPLADNADGRNRCRKRLGKLRLKLLQIKRSRSKQVHVHAWNQEQVLIQDLFEEIKELEKLVVTMTSVILPVPGELGIVFESIAGDMPMVKAIAADGLAARTERLRPGHVLMFVQNQSVAGRPFNEAMAMIKNAARPLRLEFLQMPIMFRSLASKLPQIEALRSKHAAGVQLNQGQLTKMGRRAQVIADFNELQNLMATQAAIAHDDATMFNATEPEELISTAIHVSFPGPGTLGIVFKSIAGAMPTVKKILADGLAASEQRLTPGLILMRVQGKSGSSAVVGKTLPAVMALIKSAGRPLRLEFDQAPQCLARLNGTLQNKRQKLWQIEELRSKKAAGVQLDFQQVAKLGRRAQVITEIAELQKLVAGGERVAGECTGGGSKKRKQEDLAPPGGLSEKDRQKFIHVFKKFGVVKRITDMLKDPSLSSEHIEEADVPELEMLAKSLIQACKDRKEQMRSTPSENAHLSTLWDPNVPFCGLQVNAINLLLVTIALHLFFSIAHSLS